MGPFWIFFIIGASATLMGAAAMCLREWHQGMALRIAAKQRPENFGLVVHRTDEAQSPTKTLLELVRPTRR
jgi:hypothetical protein